MFSFLYKKPNPVLYEYPEVLVIKQASDLTSKVSTNEKRGVDVVSTKFKTAEYSVIDINLADSLMFKKIPGIGVVYASRIVRYRNLLGGFYAKKQLLDVYGIDSVLFEKIFPYLLIEEHPLRRLNINVSTVKELKAHPYISHSVATLIVKYREHHGDYESMEGLKRLPLVDEQLFRKIVLYLNVE